MGAVSGAALEAGGDVAGVVPYAMVAAGGEVDQSKGIHAPHIALKEKGREKVRSRGGFLASLGGGLTGSLGCGRACCRLKS